MVEEVIIDIYLDSKKNYSNILVESLNFTDYLNRINAEFSLETIKRKDFSIFLENVSNNNFLEKYSVFRINGNLEEINNFLIDNRYLKDKKIIINRVFEINLLDYERVSNKFKNNKNVYFYITGNEKAINIDEYRETVLIIENIVRRIKRYDFSTLEKIMYVYDLVRDRVYKKELKKDDYSKSRDLSSVLLGDKIVCVGYAKMFEIILQKLGISCKTCSLKNVNDNKNGHRRNVVYVKDDKYNVEGVYYFDLTWDCKKDIDDINYLNSYKFFANTKKQIDKYQKEKFIDRECNFISKELLLELKEKIEVNIMNIDINLINKISNFFEGKNLINPLLLLKKSIFLKNLIVDCDTKLIIDTLSKYICLFDNTLDEKILFQVLFNVRYVENNENPKKYKFDLKTLYDILINSNWLREDIYNVNNTKKLKKTI